MNKPIALIGALIVAASLTACGGGGGDDDGTPSDTVPDSAAASSEAFTQFVAGLSEDETSEPLQLDGLVPPTSETDEPRAVK